MSAVLKLAQIRIDGGTQPRVKINTEAVARYAKAMTDGVDLPPMVVFYDGAAHWLADGFHRYHAHAQIGALDAECEVRAGTVKDARVYARGANKAHGLPMSNADKKAAVLGMLEDCPDWSDAAIGRHVGVDHKTVGSHRAAILGISQDAPTERTVQRGDQTYTMTPATKESGAGQADKPPADAPSERAAPQIKSDSAPAPTNVVDIDEVKSLRTEIADLTATNESLLEQNNELSRHLEETMADLKSAQKVAEADDKAAAALREAKQYREQVRIMKEVVNGLQSEKNEAIKMVKSLRRKLDGKAAA